MSIEYTEHLLLIQNNFILASCIFNHHLNVGTFYKRETICTLLYFVKDYGIQINDKTQLESTTQPLKLLKSPHMIRPYAVKCLRYFAFASFYLCDHLFLFLI